jgi:hypothetical protein
MTNTDITAANFDELVDAKLLAAARGIITATLAHAGLDREAIAKARAELVARAEQQAAPVAAVGPEPDEVVTHDDGTRLGVFYDESDPVRAATASLGSGVKLAGMTALEDGTVTFSFADSSGKLSYATLMVTNGTIAWLKDVAEVADLRKQADRKYNLTAKTKSGQRIHIVIEEI